MGQPRLITITTPKSWERYGIHALEAVYPLLEPGGWLSVANTGTEEANIVHARHADGVDVVLAAVADMYGAFGKLNVYGTKGSLAASVQRHVLRLQGPTGGLCRLSAHRASCPSRSPRPWN